MIARFNFGRKVRCHSGAVEIAEGAAVLTFRRERDGWAAGRFHSRRGERSKIRAFLAMPAGQK